MSVYVKSTLGTLFATYSGELHLLCHLPTPSVPPSNSHMALYTHGWQFTGWSLSLAFIFKSLQFIVKHKRVVLYLHDQQQVSFVLLAGSLSISLSHRMPMSSASGALADSLAFWLRRNQSGHQLPPKSHYPPHYSPKPPPPPISYISLLTHMTLLCYTYLMDSSSNIHRASIVVSA